MMLGLGRTILQIRFIVDTLTRHVEARGLPPVEVSLDVPPIDDEADRAADVLGYAEGQSFVIEHLDSADRLYAEDDCRPDCSGRCRTDGSVPPSAWENSKHNLVVPCRSRYEARPRRSNVEV